MFRVWMQGNQFSRTMVGTPATPASKIQRTPSSTPGGSKFQQEKILGTIRIRPLNRREQALYYLIAWDCPDDRTIVFKNPNHERPATPYTFATIFAYGQTTSGKAFTMSGITESAVKDIYEHIKILKRESSS
ncbi:hypothetical protein P3X46_019663 [Hevea brasiliensis]|uniref:Kinesin motor domain-containing protein n=1 Tax=Hevea brasiliensis TaxID=3981 RepID=A0ABQ9LND2_HEVBR|nr:hypothetical protein P3X46_019663 [Hevea brasiliensis]